MKESLSEAKYEVEVEVRDAKKANEIAKDMFRGAYKNDGSNVFVFKSEDDKYEFADQLDSAGVKLLENQLDEGKAEYVMFNSALKARDAEITVSKSTHPLSKGKYTIKVYSKMTDKNVVFYADVIDFRADYMS